MFVFVLSLILFIVNMGAARARQSKVVAKNIIFWINEWKIIYFFFRTRFEYIIEIFFFHIRLMILLFYMFTLYILWNELCELRGCKYIFIMLPFSWGIQTIFILWKYSNIFKAHLVILYVFNTKFCNLHWFVERISRSSYLSVR